MVQDGCGLTMYLVRRMRGSQSW